MPSFIQFCSNIAALTESAKEDFSHKLTEHSFRKGEYLLKTGQVCRSFYFVDRGLVKTFFGREDKEFIMRFFPENSLCCQLESYITQTPSTYEIIALEPTTVTCIRHTDFENLCKQHHSIETLYRKFVSVATLNMMKRISEMLEENARQRYLHFVNENAPLLQRISLGDLANYLGITQVSLSRIRSQK